MTHLTTLLGPDPLPRGSRRTWDGIWSVSAYKADVLLMTLLLAHDRIQSVEDAKTVGCYALDKLERLRERTRVEVGFSSS